MPKINKAQRYAIQWLYSQGMNSDDIAKELKVTADQIQTTLDSAKSNTETAVSSKAKDLMITHTSGKKINSVAIMTKEASEVGDAARQSAKNTSNKNSKGIFRPKSK